MALSFNVWFVCAQDLPPHKSYGEGRRSDPKVLVLEPALMGGPKDPYA